MKFMFITALLLGSLCTVAQSIKISETDTATHLQRIGTTARWVNWGCSTGFALALRSEDTAVFVQHTLPPTANELVAANDAIVFQLENNTTIVARSKGMQVSSASFNRPIEYCISLQDVRQLYSASVKCINYFSASGHSHPFRIQPASKSDLQRVCSIFLAEFQKKATTNEHLAQLTPAHN